MKGKDTNVTLRKMDALDMKESLRSNKIRKQLMKSYNRPIPLHSHYKCPAKDCTGKWQSHGALENHLNLYHSILQLRIYKGEHFCEWCEKV